MPPETATREPTITEALQGFAALPLVLSTLQGLQAQMRAMQSEIEALRRVSGKDESKPLITWQEARCKLNVSLKEAAYLLDDSETTVRRKLQRGLLKASSGTRHKKITVASLEDYNGNTVL